MTMTIDSLLNFIYKGDLTAFSEALNEYLTLWSHKIDDNSCGKTLLIRAVIASRLAIVQYLLEQKADIHKKDNEGKTVLIHAVSNLPAGRSPKQLAIIELLVEKGGKALINAQQAFLVKRTALMLSAELGYTEAVYYLLSKEADPDIEDIISFNALSHALANGHYEAAEALVHYGANVENLKSLGSRGNQGLYELFWRALRVIPKTMFVPTSTLSKQHNQNLRKHPKVTGREIANTCVHQSVAELISCYLYSDEKSLNDFKQTFSSSKAIIFRGSISSDAKKQGWPHCGRRQARRQLKRH